jgi:cytochrome b pre-mRNA-processing protein 3
MIFGLFRKDPQEDQAASLHRAVIAQSRLPAFFAPPYGVADTFEGRFELLTVNAALVLGRLSLLPEPGPALAQSLSNAVFTGFDDALREIGVSDVGVPKKMKKLARAFMGRGAAYRQAYGEGEAALAAALARNVLGGQGDGAALAAYFLRAKALLDETPADAFVRGDAPFPPP